MGLFYSDEMRLLARRFWSKVTSAEYEPKTASETVEYSDGRVERNGPRHED